MKTNTVVLVVITFALFSFRPLMAADSPQSFNKIERRLLKTDINILFEQYKKAKTLLGELEFQAGLSEAQGQKTTQEEVAALDRQRTFLRRQVDTLREEIKVMGEKAATMEPAKEKDKSQKKHDS